MTATTRRIRLRAPEETGTLSPLKRLLRNKLEYVSPDAVKPHPRNANRHSRRQLKKLADLIARLGFINPIIVDDQDRVVAGHARLAAAKACNLPEICIIRLSHLSPAELRAYMIADNAIGRDSEFDDALLAGELSDLLPLLNLEGHDGSLTGLDIPKIDLLLSNHVDSEGSLEDEVPDPSKEIVSRLGDQWELGEHFVHCGDAKSEEDMAALMRQRRARIVFTDPPWNLPTRFFQGRGKIRHRDFAEGFGEKSDAEFAEFLVQVFRQIERYSINGSAVYVCGDWRHIIEFVAAGKAVFGKLRNLIVWSKTVPGLGAPYRSQHELVFFFQNGEGQGPDNIELGKHGRNRSNIWVYPGANTFRKGRLEELAMHPTVKPVAMVADALKDASARGDIVLDPFMGSGSTIMAAERVGRRAYGLEINPQFVDVAVKRWQIATKRDAILVATGQTFEEVAEERTQDRKGNVR